MKGNVNLDFHQACNILTYTHTAWSIRVIKEICCWLNKINTYNSLLLIPLDCFSCVPTCFLDSREYIDFCFFVKKMKIIILAWSSRDKHANGRTRGKEPKKNSSPSISHHYHIVVHGYISDTNKNCIYPLLFWERWRRVRLYPSGDRKHKIIITRMTMMNFGASEWSEEEKGRGRHTHTHTQWEIERVDVLSCQRTWLVTLGDTGRVVLQFAPIKGLSQQ